MKWLTNLKKKIEDKQKLKQQKKYYQLLQEGALFLNFIYQDLQREKKNINRHQRRRFEKELYKDGKFSPEMIEFYSKKLDVILNWIKTQKNHKKVKKVEKKNETNKK